jgi:choline dehydrogenase-like flavoprotein
MSRKEYDVVIVGSGASGGMAAYTLTRKGASCLMLEAGTLPDFDKKTALRPVYELPYRGLGDPNRLRHVFQADEFNANRWADEAENPYSHPEGEPYNWVRVRMVGGKSLFWARMSFRLSDYEFKAAELDGFGESWPISYADLAPYYDRVESIFRVTGRAEGLEQLPDGPFVEDRSPYSGSIQRVIDAAGRRDIRVTKVRRSLGTGRLASSFNLTLPTAMGTGRLDIVENAVARAVTVDPDTGHASGVRFVDRRSGREMHARGKVVVLGASCLESTRLLLNSGIANSSGVLGRYLMDQFYVSGGVQALVPEARGGKAPRGLMGGGGYIPRFRNLKGGPMAKDFIRGYAVDFYSGGTPDPKYFPLYGAELARTLEDTRGAGISFTTMGDVLPRYENHVRIDDETVDAWGIPALRIETRYTDNELNMARDAKDTLSQLCEDAGFEILSAHDQMYPPGYSIHELGTCRMGKDPKKSVLNGWNQSHDVRNLFVVDGSSFVTAGSQNPTITIMALAMRASEYLAEELRAGNL